MSLTFRIGTLWRTVIGSTRAFAADAIDYGPRVGDPGRAGVHSAPYAVSRSIAGNIAPIDQDSGRSPVPELLWCFGIENVYDLVRAQFERRNGFIQGPPRSLRKGTPVERKKLNLRSRHDVGGYQWGPGRRELNITSTTRSSSRESSKS